MSKVVTLRTEAEGQESTLVAQELELSQKNQELSSLDEESHKLEKEQREIQKEMEKLADTQQDTQLQISNIRNQLTEIQELENTMHACLIKYNECIENGNVYAITEPELRDLSAVLDDLIGSANETQQEPEKQELKTAGFDGSGGGDTSWNVNGNQFNGTGSRNDFAYNTGFSAPFNDPFGLQPKVL